MLDKNEVYSMPGSVETAMVRSFMKTFMIGIRKRDAQCDCVKNFYVRALSTDGAYKVGMTLVAGEGYLVETVVSPGTEGYGLESTCDCIIDSDGDVVSYPNGNVF